MVWEKIPNDSFDLNRDTFDENILYNLGGNVNNNEDDKDPYESMASKALRRFSSLRIKKPKHITPSGEPRSVRIIRSQEMVRC